MPAPTSTQVNEILDYFGTCAKCHYPASASLVTQRFPDGKIHREIVATCGLPCGWRDTVTMARMTHHRPDPR